MIDDLLRVVECLDDRPGEDPHGLRARVIDSGVSPKVVVQTLLEYVPKPEANLLPRRVLFGLDDKRTVLSLFVVVASILVTFALHRIAESPGHPISRLQVGLPLFAPIILFIGRRRDRDRRTEADWRYALMVAWKLVKVGLSFELAMTLAIHAGGQRSALPDDLNLEDPKSVYVHIGLHPPPGGASGFRPVDGSVLLAAVWILFVFGHGYLALIASGLLPILGVE